MAPTVAAYIIHCDSPKANELLRETYDTLLASDYRNLEVIVVENGVRVKGVKLHNRLHIPTNIGFARACNVALDHCVGTGYDFALLINNDVKVSPTMVSELVRTAERFSDCGIVSPRIYYYGQKRMWYNGGVFNPWTGAIRHEGIRKLGPADTKEKETDWATGCAFLVTKEVVERVGLLNPAVSPYGEDLEYCLRVREAGWKIMVNPKAVLWHKISQSVDTLK